MSRKLITVVNQTLQNSPLFQRMICGSNGKCLIVFDEKNQKAHSGGLLMGDKNAVGTEPFMVLIGGGSVVRAIAGTAPNLDYYDEDTMQYVFSGCGYYGVVMFLSFGVAFRLLQTE